MVQRTPTPMIPQSHTGTREQQSSTHCVSGRVTHRPYATSPSRSSPNPGTSGRARLPSGLLCCSRPRGRLCREIGFLGLPMRRLSRSGGRSTEGHGLVWPSPQRWASALPASYALPATIGTRTSIRSSVILFLFVICHSIVGSCSHVVYCARVALNQCVLGAVPSRR